MRREDTFTFCFNQFNIENPEPCVMPLDSGYSKSYRAEWESLREVVEPVLVADPRNLYIEVQFAYGGRPYIKVMHSVKYNRTLGKPEVSALERKLWPEWFI